MAVEKHLSACSVVPTGTDTWIMARKSEVDPETVTADFARRWWKALMANAVALVEDAALLASHDSTGRAQSLIVLAMEELAKARWLYEAAEYEWSAPLGLYGVEPRPAGDVIVPEGLSSKRRPHAEKLQVAEQFASGLAGFWSLERRMEYYERPDLETFMATAKQRNLDKQAGSYVDRSGEEVASPLAIPADDVANAIRHTAKVVQMHLIEDHTRQQDAQDASLIDSAEDLHWAVMPFSDPELFADFIARAKAKPAG
jgi:AbiV family abortive infection protein